MSSLRISMKREWERRVECCQGVKKNSIWNFLLLNETLLTGFWDEYM